MHTYTQMPIAMPPLQFSYTTRKMITTVAKHKMKQNDKLPRLATDITSELEQFCGIQKSHRKSTGACCTCNKPAKTHKTTCLLLPLMFWILAQPTYFFQKITPQLARFPIGIPEKHLWELQVQD